MKEKIKNTTILGKTVRPDKAQMLKQVQHDMEVVNGDMCGVQVDSLIKNDGVEKTERHENSVMLNLFQYLRIFVSCKPKNDKKKTLKRVQGDMEVSRHCERMRSNPTNYLARSAYKDFSPLTFHFSPKDTSTSHLSPSLFSRRVAFTLAEVLITLGIIGVVAAMTMPSLIQHYKRQEASAKLKKFYSMMSQAVLMSEAHNGPISDWSHPARLADDDNKLVSNPVERREFFNKYLKPYLKTVKSESTDENDDTVILSDGSMIRLASGYCTGLIYDINGDKTPNAYGRDRFNFIICPDSSKQGYIDANHNFGVYYQKNASSKSRDELVESCKKDALECLVLLMYDNWEFKDDYPLKL